MIKRFYDKNKKLKFNASNKKKLYMETTKQI